VTDTTFLLDSHALLWFLFEPERLSQTALSMFRSPANRIVVSTAEPIGLKPLRSLSKGGSPAS